MSNPGNRHSNQPHHRDQSNSHSGGSSSGTEVPQASGNNLQTSTWDLGLSGREREELLMQDYIINHPELAIDQSQELNLFLQSNFQDRLLDNHEPSEKTPSSSRYQKIIDNYEEEERVKEQISPINQIQTEADDDQIDPFEQFEEKTVKNCPPSGKDPEKEGKDEKRASPFEMATRKKETYADQLSKVKIIKQWVIDRRLLSRNIVKEEQLSPYRKQREEQKNPCCPFHPKNEFRRAFPMDSAIKQYQKHINPSLENWQTENDVKVHFNRVICLKEFDLYSPPLDIDDEVQKYEILRLPRNPSHSLQVEEKYSKVNVVEMKEQVRQISKETSRVAPLIDADQQFEGAFPEEKDIFFVISDEDSNESSLSGLPESSDKF